MSLKSIYQAQLSQRHTLLQEIDRIRGELLSNPMDEGLSHELETRQNSLNRINGNRSIVAAQAFGLVTPYT